jgi:hypothetical protein
MKYLSSLNTSTDQGILRKGVGNLINVALESLVGARTLARRLDDARQLRGDPSGHLDNARTDVGQSNANAGPLDKRS